MNILHIGNQCGVATTYRKYLPGHKFTIIENKVNDPFNQTPPECQTPNKYVFYLKSLLDSQSSDIIHIHSHDKLLDPLTLTAPGIIHYHGSDIRGRWDERGKYWKTAKRVLVSTRDLLDGAPDDAQYLPNPVDYQFSPGKVPEHECAVHFSYNADEEAQSIAAKYGLPLVIVKQQIPHHEIPAVLHNYTHFVEAKRKNGVPIMGSVEDTGSLLSLEALASGLTVLCRDGERRGLPPEHRPEAVAAKLGKIYAELSI